MSRFSVFAVLPLVLIVGCGSRGPTLLPVSGTVTLNGKPMADAEVTFAPDPSNAEITMGSDTTGPQGNYKAMSQGRSGLAAGKYTVTVKQKPPAPASNLPEEIKNDPGQIAAAGLATKAVSAAPSKKGAAGKAAAPKNEPPPEVTKTFSIEVAPGKDTFDFDVKQ